VKLSLDSSLGCKYSVLNSVIPPSGLYVDVSRFHDQAASLYFKLEDCASMFSVTFCHVQFVYTDQ